MSTHRDFTSMKTYEDYLKSLGVDMDYLNTKTGGCINAVLVAKQELTIKAIDTLKALHEKKDGVFAQMRESNDSAELHRLADEVRQIEFALQRAWGFKEDWTRHRWFEVPKCTCPKMDNEDAMCTPYRIHSVGCIVHCEIKSIDTDTPVVI